MARAIRPLALFCAAGLACAFPGTLNAQIVWKASPAEPFVIAHQQDVVQQLVKLAPAGEGVSRVVVQASGPVTDAAREGLRRSGVTLLSPLGNHAYFAAVNGDALDAAAVAATGALTGVAAIDGAWKIDPRLAGPDVLTLWGQGAAEAANAADPVVPLSVVLFADVPADNAAMGTLAKHATRVQGALASLPVVVLEAPLSAVAAIAAEPTVQWVEPALPMMDDFNAENRVVTGAAVAQAAPYSLNGAGVGVLVFDSGNVRPTHQDFTGRLTQVDTGDTVSSHSTHCAGTVGGSGGASGTNRGMAPGCHIYSAGLGALTSGWLYSNPLDIEVDYGAGFDAGADLTTNSIGTNVANNGFDCSWEGDYPVTSALIDTIVRGDSTAATDGAMLPVFWAAGNERGNGRCGTTYGTVPPPSCAKNSMVIGATNSNDSSIASFSSWGPTDDGRMKPDFSAPGCQVGGDNGITSATSTSDTSYGSLCGTSMATPTVAGCAALLVQDWRVRFPSIGDPWPSTLKAIFAQSATDLGNAGPDYQFGYGSINAVAAIELARTGNFEQRSAIVADVHEYTVTVPPGAADLTITLAWDDPAATPNVSPSLVNNMDLVVRDPADAQKHVWTLNPASPATAAVQTAANTRDNLEQVKVPAPAPGVYTVRVEGTNIQQGPQRYSLVASHPIAFVSSLPNIAITATQLAPLAVSPGAESPVAARIVVQSDVIVPGSVKVRYSYTGGAPFEAVTMTDAGSGVWTATLPEALCGASLSYYFEAEGQTAGVKTAPSNAPSTLYTSVTDSLAMVASDTFESASPGWTVGAPGDAAIRGIWERAAPQATPVQPGADHTPGAGTICWVTQAAAGADESTFDVDGGATTLRSAAIDLTGLLNPEISYWRWFRATGTNDHLTVSISNDDGQSWTIVETLNGPGATQWNHAQFRVADFVQPTAAMRLRFVAADVGTGSIVEAAIDDLEIFADDCPAGCDSLDFNGDGLFPDNQDLEDFFSVFGGGACSTGTCGDLDFNNDGLFPDNDDVQDFLAVFGGGSC
ncbi:MAG TPA: S8 family serine peptidase [Phycisphaerales bacterium]|nr:S8 family serine peptidase [Phycisphaerales bacterium]